MTTTLEWHRREPPLAIVGVMAEGEVACHLARRLAEPDLDRSKVRVYAGESLIVAIAQPGVLPWVDGATWVGRDGAILCPTTWEPTLPTGLVSRSILPPGNDGQIIVVGPGVAACFTASNIASSSEHLVSLARAFESQV